MRCNLAANGLNIALTPVLVQGWGPFEGHGVAGAALATVISFTFGAFLLWIPFRQLFGRVAGLSRRSMRGIVQVGYAIGVRFLMDIGGWALLTAMLSRLGESEVAATLVAVRVISISFMPGYGISEATSIVVGQYIGAADEASALRAFRSSLWLSCVTMGIFALAFWLLPETIMGWFSDDSEVVRIGSNLLLLAALFQLVDAVAMSAIGALNGAGDTGFVMIASVAGTWLLMVPLGWWLGIEQGMGARGVWIALTAEISLRAVLTWGRWRSGAWRSKAVIQANA
jgi:MATE family multidrug resistance protein